MQLTTYWITLCERFTQQQAQQKKSDVCLLLHVFICWPVTLLFVGYPGVVGHLDLTGDGIAETTAYDTVGDGKADALDTSGDGRIDTKLRSTRD